MPTHRELARDHGIALATATRVYTELAEAGLVVGEPGRGTFVREQFGYDGVEPQRVAHGNRVADLAFNQPLDPGQADDLRDRLRELAATGDIETLLVQHPPGGRSTDRAVVATHLLDAGIDVAPENVLLTGGAQHGLDTVLRALARPGDVIAVDELTYPGIKLIADVQGIELAAVRHTDRGMSLGSLEKLCRERSVKAVYTMPTLHNPLGSVMGADDRSRMAAVARRYDTFLIEDATYAFLAPDAPAPLYAVAPERTVYVASLSKNLATGLRFGFLVAPTAHRHRLVRTLKASSWGTPPIIAALAVAWLRSGAITRWTHQRRIDARSRQHVAARVFSGLDYRAHPAAYFGWLRLPSGIRAVQMERTLAAQGILVSTADEFSVRPHPPAALRISLSGTPTLATLERVLETIRTELPP
ncbi:putative transcriptional regulator, GntR family protein [Nocardiopsis ansamitocini]|uniref:Transcriptional regulator, GntR family protein n=2 Tax=Nocardiopsis ansamitocini TaxID=1670832 RepID=A0A9W6P4S6_9ACTN|nr:putative transcriptional regulator, GntR family protein [Nocardiopsis ansamitocini]